MKNVRNFQKFARLSLSSVVVVCVTKTERGTQMAKKRANGEGNIRKRKDGRWEGRYTAGIDPETGKPIAKNVLARTQRECKEKLQKAMEELEKIDVTKRRDYTVGGMGAALVRELRKAIRPRIHGGILQELHRPAYRAAHRGHQTGSAHKLTDPQSIQ